MSRPVSERLRTVLAAAWLGLAALLAHAAEAPATVADAASVPTSTHAAGAPTSALAAGAPTSAHAAGAPASAAAAGAPTSSLDTRIQAAKAEVIRLNRDLLVLEEELLFPANTQLALFVSMDVGKLFSLGSVQILLDNQVVASHLYTPLEVQALHRGGVQRLYLGNLRGGEHELVAYFTGEGPHQRDYKRGTKLSFGKGSEPKYIELQIKDAQARLQPEFEVKVWQ